MRDRLIELLASSGCSADMRTFEELADYLIENGVILSPCKVGDTVYYINTVPHIALRQNSIYKAKVIKIVTTMLDTSLVIQIRDESGCCEIPSIKDFGTTVFLSKEEAEKALSI